MADLAILLKLGTNGDRIVVRKASGDPNNSGLEIFRKGPLRDRNDARGPKGKGDPRGKESEWTAEGAAGECPDGSVPAPKTLSPRSLYTTRSRRQGPQQGPGSSRGQYPDSLLLTESRGLLHSPAPSPPAWERNYRQRCRAQGGAEER